MKTEKLYNSRQTNKRTEKPFEFGSDLPQYSQRLDGISIQFPAVFYTLCKYSFGSDVWDLLTFIKFI